MKFQLLPLGARFEYQGKVYVKTGPLTASSEQGGQRMIPRSATLRPLDGPPPAAAPKATRKLDEAIVLAAFDACHARCLAALEAGTPDATRAELEAARRGFLAALGREGA